MSFVQLKPIDLNDFVPIRGSINSASSPHTNSFGVPGRAVIACIFTDFLCFPKLPLSSFFHLGPAWAGLGGHLGWLNGFTNRKLTGN